MVVKDGLAVCFEDGLGGHCEKWYSKCRLGSVSNCIASTVPCTCDGNTHIGLWLSNFRILRITWVEVLRVQIDRSGRRNVERLPGYV